MVVRILATSNKEGSGVACNRKALKVGILAGPKYRLLQAITQGKVEGE